MNRTDVVPEVLWTPTPERVARAAITDFTAFVADRTGRELPDYAALWEFSTQDLAGFWSAVADYFEVRWHDQPTEVLPAAVMPGADWFPGGTLNYAEHALAGLRPRTRTADPAVIAVAEDGTEQLLTLAQLRGAGRRRAGGPARLGRRRRRPGGRAGPELRAGAGRVPGHRGPGRGVVVVLAGLRCARR